MPISKQTPSVPPSSPDRPMSKAPRDGTIVLLAPDYKPARYVTTRRFIGGRWTPVPKWVNPLTGQRLTQEPTGWIPLGDGPEDQDDREHVQQDDSLPHNENSVKGKKRR